MIYKPFAFACCCALCGCHFLAAPAIVGASTALGIGSGVVSVAKDVLELDVSIRNLAGEIAPQAPPK